MQQLIVYEPQEENTDNPFTTVKRNVCGYARVSTEKEEQTESYESQVSYYRELIKSNPKYNFVGIYADEGITGTSIRKRPGFCKMIEDALAGKIDLILTKSISRFARNTVDSLLTIRNLKEHNIECFFEKENISTFDSKGELLLTIMSSIAQEESRSISLNVSWGIQRRMAKGIVVMPVSNMLGFKYDENKNVVIDPDTLPIVRSIYYRFADGYSYYDIAKALTKDYIPSPMGKPQWHSTTIRGILTNEKYIGDARLQKTFTQDFLTKKHIKNEGQRKMYYIKDHHEPLIEKELFDHIQNIIKDNSPHRKEKSITSIYQVLYCETCGYQYVRKANRNGNFSYVCLGRARKKCNSSPILHDIESINEFIQQEIQAYLSNPDTALQFRNKLIRLYDTNWLEKESIDLNGIADKCDFTKNRLNQIHLEISRRKDMLDMMTRVIEGKKITDLSQLSHFKVVVKKDGSLCLIL